MTLDDFKPESEFTEAVPRPEENEIDALVDRVSAGAAPTSSFAPETPAPTMRRDWRRRLDRLFVLRGLEVRWIAAPAAAFAIGLLVAVWQFARLGEPAREAVSRVNPPATVTPAPTAPPQRTEMPPNDALRDRRAAPAESPAAVAPPAPAAVAAPAPAAAPAVPRIDAIAGSVARRDPPAVAAPPVAAPPVAPPPVVPPAIAPSVVAPPTAAPAAPEVAVATGVPEIGPTVAPERAARAIAISPPKTAGEEASVRQVLREYIEAYAGLDVDAAANIWPSVDRRALSRAFATVKTQNLEFEQCDVKAEQSVATAHCRGTVQYVRKIGSPTPHVAAQEWLFQMQKKGSDWKIQQVSATRGTP